MKSRLNKLLVYYPEFFVILSVRSCWWRRHLTFYILCIIDEKFLNIKLDTEEGFTLVVFEEIHAFSICPIIRIVEGETEFRLLILMDEPIELFQVQFGSHVLVVGRDLGKSIHILSRNNCIYYILGDWSWSCEEGPILSESNCWLRDSNYLSVVSSDGNMPLRTLS